VCHELSRCRQASCTDRDTKARRLRFLADLKRATESVPANRIRWMLATSTATSTTTTWRYET
jgi:hypothetical protein